MLSWILPKNKHWGNFRYINFSQRSIFGRIQDNIYFFQDFLTFTTVANNTSLKSPEPQLLGTGRLVYKRQKYLAKVKGFHYWPPKFNSKDPAFVFALELFVLFLSLKQEMEQDMDNNF